MTKNLIIGSNGYLGRHLCRYFNLQHESFIPVSHSQTSIDNYDNYRQVDITNFEEVNGLDLNVDRIYLLSAKVGTADGFNNYKDYLEVNELGVLNLLNACVEQNVKPQIVFPSSRLVYKGVKDLPLKEDSEKEAKTIYAQNKLAAEGYLKMYENLHGISYTIFRICVVYGNMFDSKYSYGTMGFFLSKALKNEAISLYGEGEPKRTFTHIEDVVNVMGGELDAVKNQTLNIGSNDNFDLSTAANLIASYYKVEVNYVAWPEQAKTLESGDTMFDDDRLQRMLGYTYKHDLKNWIELLRNGNN